jgi:hypothetical protein
MATPDHTPRGRGYDSSLSFFYHCNDYYNFTVDDDFGKTSRSWMYMEYLLVLMQVVVAGAGPHSCRTMNAVPPPANAPEDLLADESIVDLWIAMQGGPEGPAHGLNNSFTTCYSENDAYVSADPNAIHECRYEDALFRDYLVAAIDMHDFVQPLFVFYAPHIAHEPLQVPQDYYDRFAHIETESRRRYAAMVNFMDGAIESVTDAIVNKGVWDNTLVVFSADNVSALCCMLACCRLISQVLLPRLGLGCRRVVPSTGTVSRDQIIFHSRGEWSPASFSCIGLISVFLYKIERRQSCLSSRFSYGATFCSGKASNWEGGIRVNAFVS